MAGYEHALFIILLLGYLLIGLRDRHQLSLFILMGGVFLALLAPFVRIKIPWDLVLALILPWILSQYAQNWLHITWKFLKRDMLLWVLTVICLGLIVHLIGGSAWLTAASFGIIAASMFWQLSRWSKQPGLLEVLGPLTLIILLVETSLPLNDPNLYIGSLFSGAGIGVILAIFSLAVIKKVPERTSKWILLIQSYLAYWIAYALKISPIAAVLIGFVIVIEFYLIRRESKENIIAPVHFNDRAPFYILMAIFIFTTWQTHQPMAPLQWSEVILGLLIGLLIAFLGQRIGVPRFENLVLNRRNILKLGLFLFGFLLLWPRGSELKPVIIWVALGMGAILPAISAILVAALRDLATQKHVDDPEDI
jgi:hypothetical protein